MPDTVHRVTYCETCCKNQLHVIYEDRLEILSFNHDYFVDQEAKLSGITYRRFA
jgi:hypothetical protein